jgi:hypothetical protein
MSWFNILLYKTSIRVSELNICYPGKVYAWGRTGWMVGFVLASECHLYV